ncbi:MAG: ferritin family protein [Bacteroidota bacterium]|nr:ferritin family protein [Bacteroidota bacterium]
MKKIFLSIIVIVFLFFSFSGCGRRHEKKGKESETKTLTNKKTVDNIITAFQKGRGKSAQYSAYAKKAKEEKIPEVEKLFQVMSKSEAIEAENMRQLLNRFQIKPDSLPIDVLEVKTTAENLENVIKDQSDNFEIMFPEYIKVAQADSITDAITFFKWAMSAEKEYKELSENALKKLKEKKLKSLPYEYYLCPKCGNIYTKKSTEEKCGFCTNPKANYKKF